MVVVGGGWRWLAVWCLGDAGVWGVEEVVDATLAEDGGTGTDAQMEQPGKKKKGTGRKGTRKVRYAEDGEGAAGSGGASAATPGVADGVGGP